MSSLRGITAVVTGASRGIGLAVSRMLVGEGVRTCMLARTAETLEQAASELGELARAYPCDVTHAEEVQRVTDAIIADCEGGPDLLVNNAGLFPLAGFEETSAAEFAAAMQVNLVAPFHLARAFLPGMRKRKRGHIVLIGSVADRNVFPGNATYAASKFGARAMHEVLRLETKGSGVRTSLISPSATDTSIWDAVDPDNRTGFTKRADMLRPEAVADAVLWTISRPDSVNIDELRLSRS